MKPWRISSRAVRTAQKMCRTILENKNITSREADQLLNATTRAALLDLLDDRVIWKVDPGARSLYFKQFKAACRPGREIGRRLEDEQVEADVALAESIFDRYELDDEERDTLFTALPCLGLKALQPWLKWIRKPPFPEVTHRPE